MYGLSLVTAQAEEPITLADAKQQLSFADSYTQHDQQIRAYIVAARQYVENHCGIAICTQTWDYLFDKFPPGDYPIYIPKPPLASVTHVKYYDGNGTQQTWSSSGYVVSTGTTPGTVRLAYSEIWPSYRLQPNGLSIRFVAGYGGASSVPQAIKHACLLLVTQWFEHRTEVVAGASVGKVDHAVHALLQQYRAPDEFIAYAEAG